MTPRPKNSQGAREARALYRAAANPHGVVHLASKLRAFVKCGRRRARLEPTALDRFDQICAECSGAAQHASKGRRSA